MLLRRAFDANGLEHRVYALESEVGTHSKAEDEDGSGRNRPDSLRFDNATLRELPVDRSGRNQTRQVEGACFSTVDPTPVQDPRVVAVAPRALALVDVNGDTAEEGDFVQYFAGNKKLPGSEPAAHCYAGHQFGNFAGQLGDGAAMYLGEVINRHGERWELQFKGSGLTPFSRQADGRKVLRSSLREFLCSEAMHGLGVPTTRAGTLITSETKIVRDPLYDGNPVHERATVITRVARSFLRIGSFEVAKPTDPRTDRGGPSRALSDKGRGVITSLLRFSMRLFPELPTTRAAANAERLEVAPGREGVPEGDAVAATALFREVCRRTGQLAAMWQAVGWCHGVLNTDNVAITGVTIDYGPYGFMDRFEWDHVCNGSDDGGRYSYANQPCMARWDMRKFAEALGIIVDPAFLMRVHLPDYDREYNAAFLALFRAKLGLVRLRSPGDGPLIAGLLDTMHRTGADFTNAFRLLAAVPLPRPNGPCPAPSTALVEAFAALCASLAAVVEAAKPQFTDQQFAIIDRLEAQGPMALLLAGVGPGVVARARAQRKAYQELKSQSAEAHAREIRQVWRAWLAQYLERLHDEVQGCTEDAAAASGTAAGEAASSGPASVAPEDADGPYGVVDADSLRLREPPVDDPAPVHVPPLTQDAEWAEAARARVVAMLGVNPKLVLRNYLAQEAIQGADAGEYGPVRDLLQRLYDPYCASEEAVGAAVACGEEKAVGVGPEAQAATPSREAVSRATAVLCDALPPSWATTLCVTCSS